MRIFREQSVQLICCIITLALQLRELFVQRILLALQILNLFLRFRILMRFKNSRADSRDERGGDNCFLECSHGNGFGGGNNEG